MSNVLTKNPPTIIIDEPEQPYVPGIPPTPPTPARYIPETVWVNQQVYTILPGGVNGMGVYQPPSVVPNGFVLVQETHYIFFPASPGSPGTPSIPYSPAVTHEEGGEGWNAGARSIATMSGNGQYQFYVPHNVQGVITGFNDIDVDASYENINFALEFANGTVRVMENGVAQTAVVSYTDTDLFTISRVGGYFRFYKNKTQLYYSNTKITTTMFADASLFHSDDSIVNASLSTVIDLEFTGDAIETGTFTDILLDPSYSRESYFVRDRIIDNIDASMHAGGLQNDITEWMEISERTLQNDTIVEHATLTSTLNLSLTQYIGEVGTPRNPADPVPAESATFTERFSIPELVVEFQMIRAYSLDIIDGPVPITGGVMDSNCVEFGLLREVVTTIELVVEHAIATDIVEGTGAGAGAGSGTSVSNFVIEQATADESIELERSYLLEEYGTADEEVIAVSLFVNTIVEEATGNILLASAIPTTVVVNATASVVLVSEMEAASGVVENGMASVTISSSAVTANSIIERGVGDIEIVSAFVNNAVENASGVDFIESVYELNNAVVEHGTVTLQHAYSQEQLIAEYGVGDVMLEQSAIMTLWPPVIEYGFGDVVVQGGGMWGAWTAHLETFAMSRYTGTPYTSMAVVDGVLLGTHEAGVSRLDGDSDEGVAIEATIVHDWTDKVLDRTGELRSSEYVKHPRFIYIGAETAGVLTFTLGYIGRGGNEAFAKYRVLTKNTATATSRAILGRGITSRYLQPRISNENGAQFSLVDATLLVDQTIRRT